MEIASVKGMLDHALKGNYTVGHFDIHNLEWTQAVLTAAKGDIFTCYFRCH